VASSNPKARSIHHTRAAHTFITESSNDDPGAVTHPDRAHGGGEAVGIGQHERQGRRRVGELLDEIDMGRGGDVLLVPLRPAGPVAATAVGDCQRPADATWLPAVPFARWKRRW
jgi:hypothetical protein